MERKWSKLILVDGYNGGVAHITADQIRDHNIGMYGNGDYVLPVGDQFSYEIVDNNTVKLSSGMIVICGARAVTGYGKTETLVIENGTSGYKRSDIIVAEYSKDNESLIESVSVKVVKGTLGTSYSDPALVQGNIRAGATKRQAALYRVKINGLSIEAVEKMWTAADPLNGITVPISKGGTGATTAAAALTALGINDYIVEQAITSNGRDGYTKWASGKLEQWGAITISASSGTASAVVTFPAAFANTSFNFVMTGGRNISSQCYLIEGDTGANLSRTTTTTKVRVEKTGKAYEMTAYYRAIGAWKEV